MITNIKILEKYCTDYKKIENYEDAVRSPLIYDLHHRLEISEMQSASDLKFLHLYYHRPPEELIFLEHREHQRLHMKGVNHRGENNPNFGKHLSAETRQKMSDANKGKHLSAETKQKLSDANKGKNVSAAARKKMSNAKKGNQCALGHHCSAETRAKLSENNSRYWKGKNLSAETRQKISNAKKGHKGYWSGKHWHLENGHRVLTD